MVSHIAIVCGAGYISGKEVMALELATGLRDAGYDVEVVATLWGDGVFAKRLQALNFPVHQMRLGYISATPRFDEIRMTADQMIHLPSLYWSYRRFLRTVAPTRIIHTNWQHLLLLLPFLKSERDLFWVHEIAPDKIQYRKLFALFSKRLSHFVAVSQAVAEGLVTIGMPRDQVAVIHNGLAKLDGEKPEGRQLHEGTRIGIVGQIGPWKGHEDLLRAFALLLFRGCANWELHVFGANTHPYAAHLRALARELNLNDKIVWHGFVSDRAQIYTGIDICVVPSRSDDPLPTVAIEAAMSGLPCVATRKGGLPEIVKDQITGLLVDSNNPEQLARALHLLINNAALRVRMGTAARQFAYDHFSRERLVKEFAGLIER